MDGVLVIDKHAGPTSHDMVRDVRKLLHVDKVGHTGTLDPMATGVLPLVLGSATKITRYLTGSNKAYEGVIRLGIVTDTQDRAGTVQKQCPVDATRITETRIQDVLQKFQGTIFQVPPMHSAKKQNGIKLYTLARKGIEVERVAKQISIYKLELLKIELPDLWIRVFCGAGTYIRTLAHDVGEQLGCGGHLQSLRRVQAGPFSLAQSLPFSALKEQPELAQARLVSLAKALQGLQCIKVPKHMGRLISTGYQLSIADLRNLEIPEFSLDEAIILSNEQDMGVIAIARSLFASNELSAMRRDQRAFKIERVLLQKEQLV